MINYMYCLGLFYPTVVAVCFGDPNTYANIRWEGGDPLPSEADILVKCNNHAVQLQIEILSADCEKAISDGFVSDALGTAFHYDYSLVDQINLNDCLQSVTNPIGPNPITSISYPVRTIAGDQLLPKTYLVHTTAQLLEVFNAGLAFKRGLLQSFNERKAELLATVKE